MPQHHQSRDQAPVNPDVSPPSPRSSEIPYRPGMNITSLLGEIALNPVDVTGKATTPVTYDSNCLEEICGSCAMLINGKARMACSALVDKLRMPAHHARAALQVPRRPRPRRRPHRPLREPQEGQGLGPHRRHLRPRLRPTQFPQIQEQRYPLSNCISCCCCMEVCPQFNDVTNFVGAATIAQAKLFNMDPSGAVLKEERLRALAGDGGMQECGFAQNCVEACPKELPLTEAISDMGRDVFVQQVKDFFRF